MKSPLSENRVSSIFKRDELTKSVLCVLEGKSDYEIYHKTYTSAMAAVTAYIKKNGYSISEDEWHNEVTTGQGKPSAGKTTRHQLTITDMKTGKESKKRVHVQVYNRETNSNPFELNAYIS